MNKRGILIYMLKRFLLFVIFLLYINSSYANYFISIDMPVESLSVKPGEDLSVNIDIISIEGNEGRKDYNLVAYVLDEEGNKIAEDNKILTIENEASTVVKFSIPSNVEPGIYNIKVILDGDEKTGRFIIKEPDKQNINSYIIYIIVFIFLCFFTVFYIYNRKLNKLVKHIKKIHIGDIIKKRKR